FKEGVKAGVFDNKDIKMKAYSILGAINWIPRWYSSSGKLSPQEIAVAMADFLLKGIIKS
ncbi:MAG: TetR/AcrR family transcriptional regulator, partial [Pseudomonadota bacterium]